MTDQAFHIISLLKKELYGEITAEEKAELDSWRNTHPGFIEELFTTKEYVAAVNEMFLYNKELVKNKIAEKYPQVLNEKTIAPVYRVHFLRTAWFRYAAAILIALGVGAYLWNTSQKEEPPVIVAQFKSDVLPGSDRAILTLSNGEKIELNNSTSETITDGNQSIKNNNGQLVYNSERGSLSPAGGNTSLEAGRVGGLNTMSTPRGGQYKLTLSDGTKVWLNAASSITFPLAFTGNNREVSIAGEAYFEVSKNISKPFIVSSAKEKIYVLGTSFNINAYSENKLIKTSLVEGSVRIEKTILKPGQAFKNGKIISTNIEQDIAWRNGIFNFDGIHLRDAMQQLARWYDVEIEFADNMPDIELGGEIGRKLTLSQVLRGLENTNLHFTLEGRKLTVRP